jgi:hypothetical protein
MLKRAKLQLGILAVRDVIYVAMACEPSVFAPCWLLRPNPNAVVDSMAVEDLGLSAESRASIGPAGLRVLSNYRRSPRSRMYLIPFTHHIGAQGQR